MLVAPGQESDGTGVGAGDGIIVGVIDGTGDGGVDGSGVGGTEGTGVGMYVGASTQTRLRHVSDMQSPSTKHARPVAHARQYGPPQLRSVCMDTEASVRESERKTGGASRTRARARD